MPRSPCSGPVSRPGRPGCRVAGSDLPCTPDLPCTRRPTSTGPHARQGGPLAPRPTPIYSACFELQNKLRFEKVATDRFNGLVAVSRFFCFPIQMNFAERKNGAANPAGRARRQKAPGGLMRRGLLGRRMGSKTPNRRTGSGCRLRHVPVRLVGFGPLRQPVLGKPRALLITVPYLLSTCCVTF